MITMMVEFDPTAAATYVRLRDEAVARTVEVLDAYCMVDLDGAGEPVGVEILDAPADVGDALFEALGKSFPVLDIRALRLALSGHPVAAA